MKFFVAILDVIGWGVILALALIASPLIGLGFGIRWLFHKINERRKKRRDNYAI